MDRGGFGHAKDGTNFGAVFDGVTAGGPVNAYAAQGFAEYSLRWLAAHKHRLQVSDKLALQQEAFNIFQHCISHRNNSELKHDAEGGAATGVIASCHRLPRGRLILAGASVGDASAIVINPDGLSHVVTKYVRAGSSAKDTGGQLTMCMGVHGDVNAFIEEIMENSIIVLTTDGFTDNIGKDHFGQVLDIIVRAPFFDSEKESVCSCSGPQEHAHLPSVEELKAVVGSLENLEDIGCKTIVLRISNYLKWVTKVLFDHEQQYYSLQIELQQLELEKRQADSANPNDDNCCHGKPLDSIQERIQEIEVECTAMRKIQKAQHAAAKTDDALVVAMRPVWH